MEQNFEQSSPLTNSTNSFSQISKRLNEPNNTAEVEFVLIFLKNPQTNTKVRQGQLLQDRQRKHPELVEHALEVLKRMTISVHQKNSVIETLTALKTHYKDDNNNNYSNNNNNRPHEKLNKLASDILEILQDPNKKPHSLHTLSDEKNEPAKTDLEKKQQIEELISGNLLKIGDIENQKQLFYYKFHSPEVLNETLSLVEEEIQKASKDIFQFNACLRYLYDGLISLTKEETFEGRQQGFQEKLYKYEIHKLCLIAVKEELINTNKHILIQPSNPVKEIKTVPSPDLNSDKSEQLSKENSPDTVMTVEKKETDNTQQEPTTYQNSFSSK